MRILHIGKYYKPFHGGIERFMEDLLVAQIAEGHDVTCLVHNHELSLKLVSDSIDSVKVLRSPIIAKVLFTPLAPFFSLHLWQAIKRSSPDVIHVHMPNVSAFWLLFLPSARSIPWVVHWHSDVLGATKHFLLSMAYRVYKPFESMLLKHSHSVIATSPPYAQSSPPLQQVLDKIQVIPLGIRSEEIPPRIHSETHKTKSKLKILCIGRLTYYKGQEILLKAIAQLENVELILVGTGENETRLIAQVELLNLQQKVQLLGGVNEESLRKLFEEADCLCLPSIERTEAFGVVLLEAMRIGLATIVSDIQGSGTGWVVDHEKTGLLVQPADVSELQSSIAELRDSPAKTLNLGRAGRKKFEENFDIEAVSAQVSKLYGTLDYQG